MQSAKESRERVWYSNQAVREMRGAADRNFEEIQKAVDKRKTVCYNPKVVADKRQPSEWKKLKNFLTNARERDTIKKLLSTAADR